MAQPIFLCNDHCSRELELTFGIGGRWLKGKKCLAGWTKLNVDATIDVEGVDRTSV